MMLCIVGFVSSDEDARERGAVRGDDQSRGGGLECYGREGIYRR